MGAAVIPSFQAAIEDRRLRPFDVRLLAYLQAELDLSDYRRVKHLPLARKLRVDIATIGRSLRRLTECGYVEEGPPDGRRRQFRLHYGIPRGCIGATNPMQESA